jgi:hypothetical protein
MEVLNLPYIIIIIIIIIIIKKYKIVSLFNKLNTTPWRQTGQ